MTLQLTQESSGFFAVPVAAWQSRNVRQGPTADFSDASSATSQQSDLEQPPSPHFPVTVKNEGVG